MIYKKLRKLEQQERDIKSLIIAAYQSGADPEVVMIRVSDLQHDLIELEHEVELEKTFVRLKESLALLALFTIVMVIVLFIKKNYL
jgi:hypothetical protein